MKGSGLKLSQNKRCAFVGCQEEATLKRDRFEPFRNTLTGERGRIKVRWLLCPVHGGMAPRDSSRSEEGN